MRSSAALAPIALLVLAAAALAATATNAPSACSGGWTNCGNAFANDANRATATATNKKNVSSDWSGYGFSIPSSSSIDAVVVSPDFFASNTKGYIAVRVSGDGGSTYGPTHSVGGNTAEQTFTIDASSDLAWTAAMLSDANFRVQAECFKFGNGNNPVCKLDYLPVTVTSTPFDFSVSLSPASGSVSQGNTATSTVTVGLLAGVAQSVSLSVSGCPSGATCTVSPASGNPTYNSTLTMATSASTPTGTYTVTVTGTGGGKTHSASYTLTVNAACTRANPSVALNPANQTGGGLGVSLLYNVTVTNNDNSACGSSIFNLTDAPPSGFSSAFSSSVLSLNPGSSSQPVVYNLTSTTGTPGSYRFNITATNSGATSFSGTATGFYTI